MQTRNLTIVFTDIKGFTSRTSAQSRSATVDLIREHNAKLAEADRIEIRVAINTGEVAIEEGDVYGEAVNIAARIEGIAEANDVYFTESTYLAMNKTEVPSAEIGYRMLKGIPQKIKVYRVLREGE